MQRHLVISVLAIFGLAALNSPVPFNAFGQGPGGGGGFGGENEAAPPRTGGAISAATLEALSSAPSTIDQRLELLRRSLAHRIAVNLTQMPLREALLSVARQGDLHLAFDENTISSEGLSANLDQEVTLEHPELSIRAALDSLLQRAELDWVVLNETLTVTTKGFADGHLETAIYDVANLLAAGDDSGETVDAITSIVAPDSWDVVGGPGSIRELGHLLLIRQSQRVHDEIALLLAKLGSIAAQKMQSGGVERDTTGKFVTKVFSVNGRQAEELVDVIMAVVDPDSWKDNGGEGVIQAVSGALVVSQKGEVHGRIRRLLRDLLAHASVAPPATENASSEK